MVTDRELLSYNEPIDPSSIISGWSGAVTNLFVRITDGGILRNDLLTVRNAANTAQLPHGSVDLRRRDYVTGTRDFGASGTPSQMVQNGNRRVSDACRFDICAAHSVARAARRP